MGCFHAVWNYLTCSNVATDSGPQDKNVGSKCTGTRADRHNPTTEQLTQNPQIQPPFKINHNNHPKSGHTTSQFGLSASREDNDVRKILEIDLNPLSNPQDKDIPTSSSQAYVPGAAITHQLQTSQMPQMEEPGPGSNILTKAVRSTVWKVLTVVVGALKVATPFVPPPVPAEALRSIVGKILKTAENVESNAHAIPQAGNELQIFAQQIEEAEKLLDKAVVSEPQKDKIQMQIRRAQDSMSKSWYRSILDAETDKEMIKEMKVTLFNARQVFLIQLSMEHFILIRSVHDDLKQLLLRSNWPISLQAQYTANVAGRRGCTEGTRETIIKSLHGWSIRSVPVYWMNGMAGTGKTTIAYSFCQQLEGKLNASFFCSRTREDTSDASLIIPTIAFQIANENSTFAAALLASINNKTKPAGNSPLEHQFFKLLLHPAIAAATSFEENTVVVWDGADECKRLGEVRVIVSLLLKHGDQLPFKVFIASRPETDIATCFSKPSPTHTRFILHDVERAFVKADIRVYLTESLKSICYDKAMGNWPDAKDIEVLVQRSDKLFIYAATVCHYLENPRFNAEITRNRLQHILRLSQGLADHTKYTKLDLLYSAILNEANHVQEDLLAVLATMDTPLSINAIAELLDYSRDDVEISLSFLASVLSVPDRESSITLFHASFAEFLLGHDREEAYLKKPPKYLRRRVSDVMSRYLVKGPMNRALGYAYDQWIHLATECDDIDAYDDIINYGWFVPWVRHLGQSNKMERVIKRLETFEVSSKVSHRTRISCFHLRMHLVNEREDCQLSSNQKKITRPPLWLACKDILAGHIGFALSVAFSPDNDRVASGGDDSTIRVWNARNRTEEMILKGHVDAVRSVAFSPTGQWIVSGSDDKTVRIWDAQTGKEMKTLTRHSGWVGSVAFSPDSTSVASGSEDKTVRVWDVATGRNIMTLTGHFRRVYSVAFSPSGEWIASGSDDETIRMWNTKTGKEEKKLEGHSNLVSSLAFSPNGHYMASGSMDHTIWMWDVRTGQTRWTLKGHTGHYSVAYSPDGKFIASAFGDNTIRILGAETGQELAMLEGHLHYVWSVSFSPNGKWIVSGSTDNTVRLWDWEKVQEVLLVDSRV